MAETALTESYVLITGAAGGLGRTFAAECAERGWHLLLTDLHAAPLEALAEGMRRQFGVRAVVLPCDLTDAAARDAFWEQVEARGLRLHMLINLAGTEYEGPFLERKKHELRTILRLNVEAVVETAHRALHLRAPDRRMHLLNVSSLAGFYPMPNKAVYAASKRFILDFSRALREELRGQDVYVTALCPSGVPSNPRSIGGLLRQGWVGQIVMTDPGYVVHGALDALLAGRAVYIPGPVNRFIQALTGLLPPSLLAAAIWRRWRRTAISN